MCARVGFYVVVSIVVGCGCVFRYRVLRYLFVINLPVTLFADCFFNLVCVLYCVSLFVSFVLVFKGKVSIYLSVCIYIVSHLSCLVVFFGF